ncbi:extracellular solute-binding protein [Paenibacillus sp. IB182496]|uniref:Extracellular solute-binding protein n=1 Tax=Paenibacillus sabuli TaxID=2772509 RepID=A0A927BQT6_9BACL|nr:sugar ABC transporter substrate-binding protein [Paenibacillus sabuli]MBD2844000.1 extracellular solute-binding protein [Paenibacillus sabuli]
MKKWITGSMALMVVGSVVAGCGNNEESGGEDKVLRIAMGSPGEAMIAVWEEIADEFESANPGVTVEYTFQDDDTYQTVGLPNLLSGNNAPDLYFEWAGERLYNRINDGFAADITTQLEESGLGDMFAEGSYNGMTVDGKTYMIPTAGDVTNVIFYNKQVFDELGIGEPQTWAEFLAACEAVKASGMTPITVGNLDLWTAGNWIGHLLSRVVGEDAYSNALQLEEPFQSDDFVQAYTLVQELWDRGYVNDNINAISDSESDMLFLNGQAAMHPIGSWLVPTALEEAPELEMGYFNLPTIEGGKGDQGSVIGVLNGMVVNAKSSMTDEAIAFMQLYSSDESSAKLSAAGAVPITTTGLDRDNTPELSIRLNDLLAEAPTVVAPPDTGYSIEVANALNTATSQVIGGAKSPADALKQLEETVAPLKK